MTGLVQYIKNVPPDFHPVSEAATKAITWTDWSGGLNTVNRGLNVGHNQVASILNMRWVPGHGNTLTSISRAGFKRQSTNPLGHDIKDLGFFRNDAGVVEPLVVGNSSLYKHVLGSYSLISALEGERGRGVRLKKSWVVADGGHLKFYDGTSLKMAWDSHGYILSSTAGHSQEQKLYTGSTIRFGQKFTTPAWSPGHTLPLNNHGDHTVIFWIKKYGTPPGTGTVSIRKVSDDSAVATVAFAAEDFETAGKEEKFIFTSGELDPSTQYYATVEYEDAGSSAADCIAVCYTTDTSADGNAVSYSGGYSDVSGDCYVKLRPGLTHKASIAVVHHNRLWTDDLDHPYRVRYSNSGDCCFWDLDEDFGPERPASHFNFYQGNGVTAISPFYDRLMVHFGTDDKSTHWILGAQPSEFTSTPAIPGVGALNQDVVHNLGNDLVFLDGAGLVSLRAWEAYGDIEQAMMDEPVQNHVRSNATTDRIAGLSLVDQQFWLEYGHNTGQFLVYDSRNTKVGKRAKAPVWTRYRIQLGDNVLPTAFAVFDSQSYVADSAGHIWLQDKIDPIYNKDGVEGAWVDYDWHLWTNHSRFGTNKEKHAFPHASFLVRSMHGCTFEASFHVNLSATPIDKFEVEVAVDPALTLDEATMPLDEATFLLGGDDRATALMQYEINFPFRSLQTRITGIAGKTKAVWIHGIEVDASLLDWE